MSKRANMLKRLRTKSVEREKELLAKNPGVEKGRNASQDPKAALNMMFQKKFSAPIKMEDDIDPLKFAETHKVTVDTSFYDSFRASIKNNNDDNFYFFGVYDGHGGNGCSLYLKDNS